jgi:ADP-ribose diphosphatase
MSEIPNNKPKIKDVKTIADTGIFHIESLEVDFNNGQVRTYQRLNPKGSGAVLVIPVFKDNKVALIYEFSGGTAKYELALPKGKIDTGESVLDAANRELQEEIGFGANNLTQLKTMTLAPGYQANKTFVVLAQDLYESRLIGDEPEELTVVYKDLTKLDEWVDDINLTEARSIAALYLAKKVLNLTT